MVVDSTSPLTYVLGIVQFILIVVFAIIGFMIKSFIANLTDQLAKLQKTFEEMRDMFTDHQIVDASNIGLVKYISKDIAEFKDQLKSNTTKIENLEKEVNVVIYIKKDIELHGERLNSHSKKLDHLEKETSEIKYQLHGKIIQSTWENNTI